MKKTYLQLTDSALEHLKEKVALAPMDNPGIRVYIVNPGTPDAECCLAFCEAGQQEETDKTISQGGLNIYIDRSSKPFLLGAKLDCTFKGDQPQLKFTAPKLKDEEAMETFAEQYRLGQVKR